MVNKELETKEMYENMLSKKVVKISGRPFKSGDRTATTVDMVKNPHSERWAFTFEEDDSFVDCGRCKLKED